MLFRSIVAKESPRVLKAEFLRRVQPRFNQIKEDMIEEFMNHPVTREILGGPDAANESGTLDGITNLFAFIGFDKSEGGAKQIEPILRIFDQITIRDVGAAKGGRTFRVAFPSADDIWDVTPVPWASGTRSWAQGIETGLSGIGFFAT